MKKIVIMMFLSVIVLSACTADGQESSSANQEEMSSSIQSDVLTESETLQESTQENVSDYIVTESEGNQESEVETEEPSGIELPLDELVLADDEACLVKISGSAYITEQYIGIPVEWENRSEDEEYYISADDVYVNGLRTSGDFATESLEPGESKVDYCYIDTSYLVENGMTEYTDIDMTINVSGLDTDFAEVSAHIYPYGEENVTEFVRETQDTDQVLIENEAFALVVIDSGAYLDTGGYSIPVYLINKTDYRLYLTGYEGSTFNERMTCIGDFRNLEAHTSAFDSIYFSRTMVGEYGIDSAESITMRLRVYSYAKTGYIYDDTLTVPL